MPAVRLLCVIFIEFWRGVPLITVLFMANFMLPLLLPAGVSFNQLLRVLVGVSLFAAAYMAEVIRGGLQAIPKGQYEGADAMALTYWQKMRMIILPQALTLVIPHRQHVHRALQGHQPRLHHRSGRSSRHHPRGFGDPIWITPSTPATGPRVRRLRLLAVLFLACRATRSSSSGGWREAESIDPFAPSQLSRIGRTPNFQRVGS